MKASQHIFRIRREYNKWVADETLEDYSLRFTAQSGRLWSIDTVAKTALGATAFLALEAIAASLTLTFGFLNTFWAMIALAVVIILTGLPISVYAARHGLDIDLLTRSAGFGYLGSTITSLIYASFTFIFFAIEAAILASALNALLGIPLWVGYIMCAVAVIPIVSRGIAGLSRFQITTQWIWLPLQVLAIVIVCVYEYGEFSQWVAYAPQTTEFTGAGNASAGFNLTLFGAASAVMFALVAQIGEQVDYLRFMPEKTKQNARQWWFWVLLAGPGWILIGLIKMLLGSLLAYLAITNGSNASAAADPTYMYQMVFSYITQSPTVALVMAGIMVIVCQMKINVTNAYAGSLAWSNFFSRLTHSHPGRVVWLVFNVVIALILMELGIYRALESILGVFAIVAVSWLSCIAADLLINSALGLRPEQVEFKRAYLYDINPVGLLSMILATAVGIVCYLGYIGDIAKSLAHFITILICFVSVPVVALLTKGKYYIARQPEIIELAPEIKLRDHSSESSSGASVSTVQFKRITQVCCICENTFEAPDFASCPVYQGAICSLCCSLDTRCMDACKPHGRLRAQLHSAYSRILPQRYVHAVDSRVGRFIFTVGVIALMTWLLMALIYVQINPTLANEQALLREALISLYFILVVVFSVLSWLFLLTQESREIAQQESNRQTERLIKEVEAHDVTDKELQEAKENAEQANQAKSRYLSGISHELRTPLQSISGYAQLLSQKDNVDEFQAKGLNIIRRNTDYLADLIEGLLNISKIEAGRLDLYRNRINFIDFLVQIEEIFEPVARAKGIVFTMSRSEHLPSYVTADEKRLRQILINLIGNAIKYTEKGSVTVTITYRNQVADIRVQDTGVGIAEGDFERIMLPFERVRTKEVPDVNGTGLGLTIVRLLTEIMGGELTVKSELGVGSEFRVCVMLFETQAPSDNHAIVGNISSYQGEVRTILVVDDEAIHRGIISDLLQPLGFRVLEAPDAEVAKKILQSHVDLCILDISMPGEDGLSLARHIRSTDSVVPIIMLSADPEEQHTQANEETLPYNAYIVKPMQNQALLLQLTLLLGLTWDLKRPNETDSKDDRKQELESSLASSLNLSKVAKDRLGPTSSYALLRELAAHLEIGHVKGIRVAMQKLDDFRLKNNWPSEQVFTDWVRLVDHYQYAELAIVIKEYLDDE